VVAESGIPAMVKIAVACKQTHGTESSISDIALACNDFQKFYFIFLLIYFFS